jgi:hypothetical protein
VLAAAEASDSGGHAGKHARHAEQGQQPQHESARRGKKQIAARPPRRLPHAQQGTQSMTIEEIQGFQVNDQPVPALRERRDRSHRALGIRNVKFPAQRHHHATTAWTGSQFDIHHEGRLPA